MMHLLLPGRMNHQLLTNGTIRQQEVAAESLGEIGDTIASPTLIVMLRHQPSSVARHAAVALGKINDPQSVEPLKLLLQDSDKQVRYFANLALTEMNKNNL